MRKLKLLSVFVLLVLLTSTIPGAVVAQEPLPPGQSIPPLFETPEVSDMVITESSSVEFVTQQTEAGEVQMPVVVKRLEAVQTVNVPRQLSSKGEGAGPNVLIGSVTVTLWRGMGWYPEGDPNDPNTLWRVWSEGRTTADECIDGVNVWIEHEYKSGGTWVGYSVTDQKLSQGPCHTDSGVAGTGKGYYINGTEHRSHGVHKVYIDGQPHEWEERGPGPRNVP